MTSLVSGRSLVQCDSELILERKGKVDLSQDLPKSRLHDKVVIYFKPPHSSNKKDVKVKLLFN